MKVSSSKLSLLKKGSRASNQEHQGSKEAHIQVFLHSSKPQHCFETEISQQNYMCCVNVSETLSVIHSTGFLMQIPIVASDLEHGNKNLIELYLMMKKALLNGKPNTCTHIKFNIKVTTK